MQKDEERIYHSRNVVKLCIDGYDMEKQWGRLYHEFSEEPLLFSTLFEALEQMNELYDELQFPQSATQLRSFLTKTGTNKGCGTGKKEHFGG